MIVISGVLVLVALALLVLGVAGPDLAFVYASIAVSLVSLGFLVAGVVQRRDRKDAPVDGSQPEPLPEHAPVEGDQRAAGGSRRMRAAVDAGPRALAEDARAEHAVEVSDAEPAVEHAVVAVPVVEEPVEVPAHEDAQAQGEDPVVEAPDDQDDAGRDGPDGSAGEGASGQVLVVAGRPRYHAADCRYLTGKDPEGLGLSAARARGFTPCGVCKPDVEVASTSQGGGEQRDGTDEGELDRERGDAGEWHESGVTGEPQEGHEDGPEQGADAAGPGDEQRVAVGASGDVEDDGGQHETGNDEAGPALVGRQPAAEDVTADDLAASDVLAEPSTAEDLEAEARTVEDGSAEALAAPDVPAQDLTADALRAGVGAAVESPVAEGQAAEGDAGRRDLQGEGGLREQGGSLPATPPVDTDVDTETDTETDADPDAEPDVEVTPSGRRKRGGRTPAARGPRTTRARTEDVGALTRDVSDTAHSPVSSDVGWPEEQSGVTVAPGTAGPAPSPELSTPAEPAAREDGPAAGLQPAERPEAVPADDTAPDTAPREGDVGSTDAAPVPEATGQGRRRVPAPGSRGAGRGPSAGARLRRAAAEKKAAKAAADEVAGATARSSAADGAQGRARSAAGPAVGGEQAKLGSGKAVLAKTGVGKARPRKASPADVRTAKAGPAKAGPAKAGPAKAAPAKARPATTGPGTPAAATARAAKAAPARATRDKAAPTKAIPAKIGAVGAVPTRTAPVRAAAKAGPAKAGPAKAGPAKAGPAKAGPAKAGPAKAGPAKAGPAKAGPAKAGPAKSAAAPPGPARRAAVRAVPAKAGGRAAVPPLVTAARPALARPAVGGSAPAVKALRGPTRPAPVTPPAQAPAARTGVRAAKAPAKAAGAPAPPATARSAPPRRPASLGAVARGGAVVVIPDRDRFHRADCRFARTAQDAVSVSRSAAIRDGHGPCGVCKP